MVTTSQRGADPLLLPFPRGPNLEWWGAGETKPVKEQAVQVMAAPIRQQGFFRDLPLLSGVTALIGRSGQGKTTLFREMMQTLPSVSAVSWGEADVLPGNMGQPVVGTPGDLVQRIEAAMTSDVILLDSLRLYLTASSGEAAGAGGLSLQMLVQCLTVWQHLFANYGCSLVTSINPITSNPTQVDMIKELVNGSVASVWEIADGNLASVRSRNPSPDAATPLAETPRTSNTSMSIVMGSDGIVVVGDNRQTVNSK